MMDTKELLDLYKSLFETWRFEVNSHWQRSSYFAAFETVAIAACWKLLDSPGSIWAGVLLCLLGIVLTCVWLLSNNKTHFYAVYWLERVAQVEERLVQRGEDGIDFANQILERPRTDFIKHRSLVQAVPAIFFIAWTILLLVGSCKCLSVNNDSLATIGPKYMQNALAFETASLIVSVASFFAGFAALFVAKSSLSQARHVADRDQKDWKQRKWFDLYFKADEAYDKLDHFHVQYPDPALPDWGTSEWLSERNDLMRSMRTVNRMAVVFPKHPVIDALFACTAVFADPEQAVSKDQLSRMLNAVEGVRQRALVNVKVLD